MATPCLQFGGSPNVFVPLQQWNVGGGCGTPQQRNASGGRGGAGCGGGGCGNGNRNNQNAPPSNTQKKFLNFFYCLTCGYDVDHEGHQQGHHMPHVKRGDDHLYADGGACMKGQHKTLHDGTGAGQGWVLAQSITKAQWNMQHQQPTNQQQWQGQSNNWQQGGQPSQWNGGQRGYLDWWTTTLETILTCRGFNANTQLTQYNVNVQCVDPHH
jgi:hypothetical protein